MGYRKNIIIIFRKEVIKKYWLLLKKSYNAINSKVQS